jgi:hypothetical protein
MKKFKLIKDDGKGHIRERLQKERDAKRAANINKKYTNIASDKETAKTMDKLKAATFSDHPKKEEVISKLEQKLKNLDEGGYGGWGGKKATQARDTKAKVDALAQDVIKEEEAQEAARKAHKESKKPKLNIIKDEDKTKIVEAISDKKVQKAEAELAEKAAPETFEEAVRQGDKWATETAKKMKTRDVKSFIKDRLAKNVTDVDSDLKNIDYKMEKMPMKMKMANKMDDFAEALKASSSKAASVAKSGAKSAAKTALSAGGKLAGAILSPVSEILFPNYANADADKVPDEEKREKMKELDSYKKLMSGKVKKISESVEPKDESDEQKMKKLKHKERIMKRFEK